MLKRAVVLVMLLSFLLTSSLCFAQEPPSLLVLLSGSLNMPGSWDKDVYNDATIRFKKTFSPNYKLIIGDQYKKQLDYIDAGSMERADIIALFKDVAPDYILIYDFLPFKDESIIIIPGPRTASVHLKIIDVNNNTYIANKIFTYKSTYASVEGQYAKIYSDVEKEVFSKLFPLITPTYK